MIHTLLRVSTLKKEEKKPTTIISFEDHHWFFVPKREGFFFVRRRRHCAAAVVTVVSSLPNPSLTLSSFLPGSAAHMTSISLQHSAKNYPWLHCRRRGGGDGGGGGADICSWKISIVTLKEKSQTPSRIYTHTHIHTHRQPRAKPYLLIASWHPTIYIRECTSTLQW